MKTPRVSDFDPNAQTPKLKSSMDNFPIIQRPPQQVLPVVPDTSTPELPTNTQGVPRTPVPPPLSPPELKKKSGVPPRRKIKQRQPFDIYEDQYITMKSIVEEERQQGLPGSMSRMVREAIEAYLKEKYNK